MNILILQCGGPTPVINATLAALIAAGQANSAVQQIWGCRAGWAGLAAGDWVALTALSARELAVLQQQPAAALSGGRIPLSAVLLPRALAQLAARQIDGVLVIGGNGTMAAAQKLAHHANAHQSPTLGRPVRVVGVPKTVDNDLLGTDVAPGYGSAARWIAQTTRDIALDLQAMRTFDDVSVLEVMGRHVGWLAAAATLARQQPTDPPDLILLPEVSFDEADFLAKVAAIHARQGICLVVAAEGIRDAEGHFLAEKLGRTEEDATGQRALGLAPGVAPYLAQQIRAALGLRCRAIRPDVIQRSSSALASPVDRRLAMQVGEAALAAIAAGTTEVMIGLQRQGSAWSTARVPFADVVGRERSLPADYYAANRYDLAPDFRAYAQPLVGEIRNDALRL